MRMIPFGFQPWPATLSTQGATNTNGRNVAAVTGWRIAVHDGRATVANDALRLPQTMHGYASSCFTTLPSTSVKRKSRP